MTLPDSQSWLPTMEPPDMGALGTVFVDALNLGSPVGTRLPGPDDDPDESVDVTVSGFIRIEEIGTHLANELEFDCDWAIMAYHPNEIVASRLCRRASIIAGNAQGGTYTIPDQVLADGTVEPATDWYVGWSRVAVQSQPSSDPTVDLPRFRSMVTWRVSGHELQG